MGITLAFSTRAPAVLILIDAMTPGDDTHDGEPVTDAPEDTVGGGNLDDVFRAAAEWWETHLPGTDFTLRIDYGWTHLGGLKGGETLVSESDEEPGTNRLTYAQIGLDSDSSTSWFVDPTPYTSEEFTGVLTLEYNDGDDPIVGGADMNIGRTLRARTTSVAAGHGDLFSTALHEIGHALGLYSGGDDWDSNFDIETNADEDIDSSSVLPYAGARIPVANDSEGHLSKDALPDSLMCKSCGSYSVRRLISNVDILAVASISDWDADLEPTVTWIANSSGRFEHPGHWTEGRLNVVPNLASKVRFNGGINTISLNNDHRVINVNVTGGDTEVDLNSNDLTLEEGITLGGLDSAVLRFSDGGSVTTTGILIGTPTGVTYPPFIAPAPGELRIEESGVYLHTTGNVVVGLPTPFAGTGTAVMEGGTWDVDGDMLIGQIAPSSGRHTVTVSGDGVLNAARIIAFAGSRLSVGGNGQITVGDLHVDDSATLNLSGGELVVDGGILDREGTLSVAGLGAPQLRLVNGASAVTGPIHIGSIRQVGPGAYLPAPGEFRVESADVHTTGEVVLGADDRIGITGRGVAVVDNGTWVAEHAVQIGRVQDLLGQGHSLTIQNGGIFAAPSIIVFNGNHLNLSNGDLLVDLLSAPTGINFSGGRLLVDSYIGPLVQNGGVLTARSLPGTIAIAGDYTIADQGFPTLDINLGGETPGVQSDYIDITGSATLDGTLRVSLIDSFTPMLGQTFQILFAEDGVEGTFDNLLFPDLEPLSLQVMYDTNAVSLVVVDVIPGDFDADGDVDGQDFLVWQHDPSIGDLDNWQGNYGMTLLPITGSNVVPEPGSMAILLAIAIPILGNCRLLLHSGNPLPTNS